MNRNVFWFALLIACLGVGTAQGLTPEEQQRFADGLYTRKLHEMAIKEYNRIIQEFPQYAKNDIVLYRAGECARKLGQAEQAMGYYSQISKVFPKSPFVSKARLRQGEMHVQRGEYGNAIVLLKQLLDAKPSGEIAAAATYYQGFSFSKLQQYDKGNACFDNLIKQWPNSPFRGYAALEKAKNLGLKGGAANSEDLIALYKTTADDPPSERAGAEAQLALADQYFRAGRFPESSDAYMALFGKYASYPSTHVASLNAAWAHYYAKKFDVCLNLVSKTDAAIKTPKAADWIYLEANCFRHLKRDAEALSKYRTLVSVHASSKYADFAGYEIALVSFARGDYADVLAQAARMLAQPKLKEDGLWLIAESNRELEKHAEAIKHYQMIVQEFPKSARAPESMYNTGLLQQSLQRNKEAGVAYRKVASAYATHELAPRSLFAAGFCAALENDYPQAIKDWDALAKKFEKHALVDEALYQKGLAEMQIKQEPAAITTFKQLLGRNPENRLASEAGYWSGVMLERAGKPAEAEGMFKLALGKSPRADLAPKMQYRLAMVLQKQDKKGEAADFLQNLLASAHANVLDPALIEWLVRHRWEENDWQQALPAARRLTGEGVEDKWRQMGWGLLGYTYEQLDKDTEAAKAYLQGLGMESRTEEVVNGALFVGHYHQEQKQYDAAVKDYETTAAIASEVGMLDIQARAYYGLGEVSELQAKWDDASRFFMSVAVLFDDPKLSPESLYRAAQAFEKLKQPKERKQALDELAQRYPDSDWAKKVGQ